MKRSATPLPWELTDEGGIVGEAEPAQRSLEVMRTVLRSPIVTKPDPSGDIWSEAAEAIDHGVIDRLEGGEAVSTLATWHQASSVWWSTRTKTQTQPSVLVQAMVASVPQRRFGASVITRPSCALGRRRPLGPLRRQESGGPHQAQHPVLADKHVVLPAQAGSDLAMALTSERALGDHPADGLGQAPRRSCRSWDRDEHCEPRRSLGGDRWSTGQHR